MLYIKGFIIAHIGTAITRLLSVFFKGEGFFLPHHPIVIKETESFKHDTQSQIIGIPKVPELGQDNT